MHNKIKINPGLASIVLVGAFFAGWQTLLTVIVFMFAFCEVDESAKNVAIKVVTFLVGITVVSVLWNILVDGVGVAIDGVNLVLQFINQFLDPVDAIELTNIESTIASVVGYADKVVSLLLRLAEIGFVIAMLTGKPGKENIVTKKVNEYVNNALNFVSGQPAPAPVQPVAQTPIQPNGQM